MSRHEFKEKSFIQIVINQKVMTVEEFNALASLLVQFYSKPNAFLKPNFRVLKSFRVIGDTKLLSTIGSVYYKAFIREGIIQNLRVIK